MTKLSLMKTACMMFLVGAAAIAPAQNFQALVNFNKANGELAPYSSLIQGANGNVYGTTGGFIAPNSFGISFQNDHSGRFDHAL